MATTSVTLDEGVAAVRVIPVLQRCITLGRYAHALEITSVGVGMGSAAVRASGLPISHRLLDPVSARFLDGMVLEPLHSVATIAEGEDPPLQVSFRAPPESLLPDVEPSVRGVDPLAGAPGEL